MRRLNRIVAFYKDPDLRYYVNEHLLVKCGILEAVKTGKFQSEALRAAYGAQPAPPICCWVTDEEQSQLTGGEYVIEKLQVCGVRFRDCIHRCWNDLQHAVALAGLTPQWYAMAFLYNVGHGPWQSAKFWRDILAQVETHAKTLKSDDVLLQRFWPRVLIDKSMQHEDSDETVGRLGRERFIEDLAARSQKIAALRGPKVKPSVWLSFNKAHDEWDSHVSTRAMLLAQLSLNKGWILTAEDLFSGARTVTPLSQEEAAAAPASKAAAVRSAKAKAEAHKKRTANCCAAAALVAADQECINGARLIALGSRALYSEFAALSQTEEGLTSVENTARFCQSWAQWGWLAALKDTWRSLWNAEQLDRAGLRASFREAVLASARENPAEVRCQDALARTLGRFVFNIVRNRAGSMISWSSQWPNKLAGLSAAPSQTMRWRA